MDYAIDPPATVALPIRDDERWFSIHRIYCVGRNYASHAVEMWGEDIPVDRALEHVFGYATALDMTRRDLQGEAKSWVAPGRWRRRSSTRRPAAKSCRPR